MSTGKRITITDWVHNQLEESVQEAEVCVDATVGKGKDTLFLLENMETKGRVIGFDIQKEALNTAEALLQEHGYMVEHNMKKVDVAERVKGSKSIAQLILDGHENMDRYILQDSVDIMMFNLGYLPGGDHALATRPETTIEAIGKGLSLLKCGGVMSVCIYSGGDSGFEERNQVLDYLEALDAKKYTVIVSRFHNKPNHPPIPVFIRRDA